jgi:hypothetical protein
MAATAYGFFIGIVFFVLSDLIAQPLGSLVFWSVVGIQLSWAAVTCWRRTGLPFATASMASGAVTSGCLVVLAAMGSPFPNLAPESWVFFAGATALGPLFLFIESRVNPSRWKQWAQHMERTKAWDMFTGRHIPQLRDGGA